MPLDVEVASGARVLGARSIGGASCRPDAGELNGDGAFCAVTFVTGGNLARHETHIRLLGEGRAPMCMAQFWATVPCMPI